MTTNDYYLFFVYDIATFLVLLVIHINFYSFIVPLLPPVLFFSLAISFFYYNMWCSYCLGTMDIVFYSSTISFHYMTHITTTSNSNDNNDINSCL